MPRLPKAVAGLAALVGVLTIITAISFATMPDPFVRQFGWFVVVLGTMGGVALVATGAWQLAEPDRRIASLVLAVLALGDVACNLASFRAGSLGVIPIPTALHAATAISAFLVAILSILNWVATETHTTVRARPRPIAPLGRARRSVVRSVRAGAGRKGHHASGTGFPGLRRGGARHQSVACPLLGGAGDRGHRVGGDGVGVSNDRVSQGGKCPAIAHNGSGLPPRSTREHPRDSL